MAQQENRVDKQTDLRPEDATHPEWGATEGPVTADGSAEPAKAEAAAEQLQLAEPPELTHAEPSEAGGVAAALASLTAGPDGPALDAEAETDLGAAKKKKKKNRKKKKDDEKKNSCRLLAASDTEPANGPQSSTVPFNKHTKQRSSMAAPSSGDPDCPCAQAAFAAGDGDLPDAQARELKQVRKASAIRGRSALPSAEGHIVVMSSDPARSQPRSATSACFGVCGCSSS